MSSEKLFELDSRFIKEPLFLMSLSGEILSANEKGACLLENTPELRNISTGCIEIAKEEAFRKFLDLCSRNIKPLSYSFEINRVRYRFEGARLEKEPVKNPNIVLKISKVDYVYEQLKRLNTKYSQPNRLLQVTVKAKQLSEESKTQQKQESLYEIILEKLIDGWWEWDAITKKIFISQKIKRLIGFAEDKEYLPISTFKKIIHPEGLFKLKCKLKAYIKYNEPFELSLPIFTIDKKEYWIIIKGSQLTLDNKLSKLAGIIINISKQKSLEATLDNNLSRMKLLSEGYQRVLESDNIHGSLDQCALLVAYNLKWDASHVYIVDGPNKRLVSTGIWHHSISSNTGAVKKQVIQASFAFGEFLPGKVWETKDIIWVECIQNHKKGIHFKRKIDSSLASVVAFPIFVREDVYAICELYSTSQKKEDKDVLQVLKVFSSQVGQALEKKIIENKLERLAHFDFLTNIPNRRMFNEKLNQLIKKSKRSNTKFGLFFLDLDKFKSINDNYGHHVGDLLLQNIVDRIENEIRGIDFFARLSGDEFAILIERNKSRSDLKELATRIISILQDKFKIDNHQIRATFSIGITIYPDGGEDIKALMKSADSALYRAKESGRNTFSF